MGRLSSRAEPARRLAAGLIALQRAGPCPAAAVIFIKFIIDAVCSRAQDSPLDASEQQACQHCAPATP